MTTFILQQGKFDFQIYLYSSIKIAYLLCLQISQLFLGKFDSPMESSSPASKSNWMSNTAQQISSRLKGILCNDRQRWLISPGPPLHLPLGADERLWGHLRKPCQGVELPDSLVGTEFSCSSFVSISNPPLDLEALVLCGARWLDFCPASDSRDLFQSFAFKQVDALGPDASVALHRHLQDFCQRWSRW